MNDSSPALTRQGRTYKNVSSSTQGSEGIDKSNHITTVTSVTTKRPRGRPRKHPPTSGVSTEGNSAKKSNSAVPPKRRGRPPKAPEAVPKKRGRPPKITKVVVEAITGDSLSAEPPPTKRQRVAECVNPPETAHEKRGRGRPPKVCKVVAVEANGGDSPSAEQSPERPKVTEHVNPSETAPEKRGRGRPPKVRNIVIVEVEVNGGDSPSAEPERPKVTEHVKPPKMSETAPEKRGRGRPPKVHKVVANGGDSPSAEPSPERSKVTKSTEISKAALEGYAWENTSPSTTHSAKPLPKTHKNSAEAARPSSSSSPEAEEEAHEEPLVLNVSVSSPDTSSDNLQQSLINVTDT